MKLMPISAVRRVAVTLLLLWCFLAQAAEQPPWESTPFTGEPAAISRAAAAGENAKDVNVVVLLSEDEYSFDASGSRLSRYYMVYKVVTATAVENWSSIRATWEPWHQQRPELRARVITPDGHAHVLDPQTISEAPVRDESDNVFSDRRVLQAPLPAVSPQSVVEQEIVIRDTAPLFAAGVVTRTTFGERVPVRHSRLKITHPKGMPLRHLARLLPNLSPHRSESDEQVTLLFEVGPLEPVEDAEPYSPGDVPSWPQVVFSTGKSWNEVAARYSNIVDQKIAGTDVSAFSAKAKGKGKSREAVVSSLIAQLHHAVRYTGVEFGEAALIPQPVPETLKRHYGDCKDKATALVAMLRTAGIPAYLALLNAGSGEDSVDDMPGLGNFDHAIVYAPGSPDLWIDATAQYMRVGSLPGADQGRLALVVRPETTALIRTPEFPSTASRVFETREFFLAEDGPARVVETSQYFGEVEGYLRDSYSGADTKQLRDNLESYVKSHYLAEKLGSYERTSADDLTKPFELRLEAVKAKRGSVTLTEAVVAIPVMPLLSRLPAYVQEDEETSSESKESSDHKRRKHELVLPSAFVTEWRYRVVPPPGFKVRSVPANEKKQIGPALLSQEFVEESDGTVTAELRFDSVKRRWTPSELETGRSAISTLKKADLPLVQFVLAARSYLQAGQFREGLAEYRRLIELHPREAVHHTQLAYALLTTGMGDAAREEARLAIKLEPTSVRAYTILAWILQHDLVGRRFEKGCDLAGAEAAYRKAKELDPDDAEIRSNLAILLEHSVGGERYSPKSKLDQAIAEYRDMKENLDKAGMTDNLLYALMYASRFEELASTIQTLPTSDARAGMRLVALAALKGSQAAVSEVARLSSNEQSRARLLTLAADTLVRLRRYPEASELLKAAAQMASDSAALLSRASMIAKAKRYENSLALASDPRRVVQNVAFAVLATDKVDDVFEFASPRILPDRARREKDSKKLRRGARILRTTLAKANLTPAVAADLGFANIQTSVEGDDSVGYRIRMQAIGSADKTFYVVKENRSYLLAGSSDEAGGLALEALDRLEKNDQAGARRWLDWARDEVKLQGGEDPLAGHPFPRFWSKGQPGDVDSIRYAASALLSGDESFAVKAVPTLLEGRAKAGESEQLKFDLALGYAYEKSKMYADAVPVAQRLQIASPDSLTAFRLLFKSLRELQRIDEAERLGEARLRRFPDDPVAIRFLAMLGQDVRNPQRVQQLESRLIDVGRGEASDFNTYAWSFLFADKVTDDAISMAQRGVSLTENKNPALLHTLASLYAEVGKTAEAQQLILQAMELWGLEEPDSESWYVFGRIAEQLGLKASAIGAYSRVEAPEEKTNLPVSTYSLAQRRVAKLRSLTNAIATTH